MACGGETTPPDDDGSGPGGEDVVEAPPPREDVRELGTEATYADLLRAARTLDDRRDQDSSAGCLLRRGWRLEADLAVAFRVREGDDDTPDPMRTPPSDLDARFENGEVVAVLSRWGLYGESTAERVALSAVSTTVPPATDPAVVWALTDRGVYQRASDGAASSGPVPLEQVSVPESAGALFVTAEASIALTQLAALLERVPASLTGRVAFAVVLEPGTVLRAPSAEADIEGLCPDGLPPPPDGMPEGRIRTDRIVSSLGPLQRGAGPCVGTASGPGAGGGRVVLGLRIGPDGRLLDACMVEEYAADAQLRRCLLDAARATIFAAPDPPGFVDVSLPMSLEAVVESPQRALCD